MGMGPSMDWFGFRHQSLRLLQYCGRYEESRKQLKEKEKHEEKNNLVNILYIIYIY